MTKLPSKTTTSFISQCLRIAGAGIFVSALGITVIHPVKQSVSTHPSCQQEQTPATLVINAEEPPSPTCVLAILS